MGLTIDLEAGLRPPPPPERGTPDGRFAFQKKLGEGAEGQVYLAIPDCGLRQQPPPQQQEKGLTRASTAAPSSSRNNNNGPVAIKVVSGKRAYERCRANRGLWRKLVHPNVVFPRESWWDDANGWCFVRMELCETDLLDLVCDKGPLSEERGSVVVGHLASALCHLHGQGIAHQDVKLENIFISRDGVAKLGDLGSIVRIVPDTVHQDDGGSSSSTGDAGGDVPPSGGETVTDCGTTPSSASPCSSSPSFVGSVMYAPPEFNSSSSRWMSCPNFRNSHNNNDSNNLFSADMWALGVSIWSAMAGCHPWEVACVDRSKGFQEFVRRGATATLPRSFSPGLRSLLARLLSLNPQERPTAAEVLASPWVSPPPTTPSGLTSGEPGPNAIPSWPSSENFHSEEHQQPKDREQEQEQEQERKQHQQEQQPVFITPVTPTGDDISLPAGPVSSDEADGVDASSAAATSGAIAIAGGIDAGDWADRGCYPVEEGKLFGLEETSNAMGAAAAAAAAAAATDTDGAMLATPRATTITSPPTRSRRPSKRKRAALEDRLGAGVVEDPGSRRKTTPFVALEQDPAVVDERHREDTFSPEVTCLGGDIPNVGNNASRDCSSCCCCGGGGGSGGGRTGERPTKVVRVSPSPLTLPEVAVGGVAELEAAARAEDVSQSLSGLGTQQSLLSFLRVPSPNVVQALHQYRGGGATRSMPASALDASAFDLAEGMWMR